MRIEQSGRFGHTLPIVHNVVQHDEHQAHDAHAFPRAAPISDARVAIVAHKQLPNTAVVASALGAAPPSLSALSDVLEKHVAAHPALGDAIDIVNKIRMTTDVAQLLSLLGVHTERDWAQQDEARLPLNTLKTQLCIAQQCIPGDATIAHALEYIRGVQLMMMPDGANAFCAQLALPMRDTYAAVHMHLPYEEMKKRGREDDGVVTIRVQLAHLGDVAVRIAVHDQYVTVSTQCNALLPSFASLKEQLAPMGYTVCVRARPVHEHVLYAQKDVRV